MASSSKNKYTQIKDYILKEDIGEGNFGKVKLGISKTTKEEYAIKIINKNQIKIKMKNKIFRENEVITKFNHINVIFVFEIIEDPENYYIVMEYCKKGELFDYIVAHERLLEDEAAIFFYQLINGVEYIHSKGIAHRDLKPENLLLTKDNTLKIIDFGLSHEFDGIEYLKTKCGSPSYASPEILRGKPYDGFKSDVWSCGIILYAMICGYLPFDGENNKILFKNIMKCQPEIPENLNDYTQDLIVRILTSDPDMRITIDEIKRHKFYLRGKKLCHIDYKMIEKNVLKKRRNKSSFKLNEDDNTYFIAENDFMGQKEINLKPVLTREEKIINDIIYESKNKKNKDIQGNISVKIGNNNNENTNNEEINTIKSRTLNTEVNTENSVNSKIRAKSSNGIHIYKGKNNDKNEQNYNYDKIEMLIKDSIEKNNIITNNLKKESFKQINNQFNNEMDVIFSNKRNNHENINFNNIPELNNKTKNEQITPKNANINVENSIKNNQINKFLQNIGKNNLQLNTLENESKLNTLKIINSNEANKNKNTLQYISPDKFVINKKYTPTIVINDDNHKHILNINNNNSNNNNNQIFDKIRNSFNKTLFTTNKENIIAFNNFNGRINKNKNFSIDRSNNTNNENIINEKNNIGINNNLNNNFFHNKKSPDEISLSSLHHIKFINNKQSNKDSKNLYYNNINININNYNIKSGNNKKNKNYIPNYLNNKNQLKYKITKKHSITNMHSSKLQYHHNTENNNDFFKIKSIKDNKTIFTHNLKNNYINSNDYKNNKLPSKTLQNFFKPKNYYNFDKISFHSTNNNIKINKNSNYNFRKNIFGLSNKIEKLKIKGGSEGRTIKHSNLENFLNTFSGNKTNKNSKKLFFLGSIKSSNNNYNPYNIQKYQQFLPLMGKK